MIISGGNIMCWLETSDRWRSSLTSRFVFASPLVGKNGSRRSLEPGRSISTLRNRGNLAHRPTSAVVAIGRSNVTKKLVLKIRKPS
jgi:hypothetical protein